MMSYIIDNSHLNKKIHFGRKTLISYAKNNVRITCTQLIEPIFFYN